MIFAAHPALSKALGNNTHKFLFFKGLPKPQKGAHLFGAPSFGCSGKPEVTSSLIR
jgi:hypothetical protein